ncbi:glycerophosphodiester phosphodiesterase family protein [Croceibacterium aestuarii]|uniref:glycerophosphodiester phosphodiesterase family protein n=1 Tax=Croceibacterium aestuarii TaxID=3064139 RepID=UPI00272E8651|nr:glycerophosphodiester phosphodiesterase family protein [Croceibacterium sp. D39]
MSWLRATDYAHRGLHISADVENSLGAASGAIARGMGIECDVQLSRDGRAMVFHDWELDRLTAESGPVRERTAAQLVAMALMASGERIPTLRDLLGLVRGRVPLLIEIKSKREMRIGAVCLAVRRELEGYRGEAAVMSFDPRVVAWFGRNAPSILRGLVMTEENDRGLIGSLRRHLWLWKARPDFLAYDVRDLPSRFAAAQRRRGVPVLTWTVSSPALRERAAQFADAPIAEGEGVAKTAANP